MIQQLSGALGMSQQRIGTWQLDHCIRRGALTELWECHDHTGLLSGRFVAKVYLGDPEADEYDYFARQAAVGTLDVSGCLPLVDFRLHAARPVLVYRRVEAQGLDVWLHTQTQAPPLAILFWLGRQLLQSLSSLHELGFVHGNIRPEHVLLDTRQQIHMVGLGGCEPSEQWTSLPRFATRFDAPETERAEYQALPAQDVFAAGVMLRQLLGAKFADSPIARSMVAEHAGQRPSARALVPCFLELEQQVFGGQVAASRRAA